MHTISLRCMLGALSLAALATLSGCLQGGREFILEGGEWREAPTLQPGEGEPVLAEAARLLAEGDASRARSLADEWLEEHEATNHRYLPDAYLIRGDARRAQGDEYSALYDYEALIKGFPASDLYPLAIEREMEIADDYLEGKRRKFLGMRIIGVKDIGVEILIRVQERLPGSDLAERAAIRLADYYYNAADIAMAGDAYDLYLMNHPRGPHRAHAMLRRIYTDLARFKGPSHDASSLIDARYRIREFAAEHPLLAQRHGINDGLLARVDESLAAQYLRSAEWYLKQGDWAAARLTLTRLVEDYPRTSAGQRAADYMVEKGWMERLPEDVEGPATPVDQDEPPIGDEG